MIALIAGALAAFMLTSCNDTVDTETTASSAQSSVSTEASTTESSSETTDSSSSETTDSSISSSESAESSSSSETEESSSSATESETTTTDHNHVAVGAWDRNATEHWQLCEDGEKFNVGVHTLNEESTCTVCNSYFMQWDDHSVSIYDKDSHGETVRCTVYDADGNVEYEAINDIVYDDGNKVFEKTYENGILTGETSYNANGDILFNVFYQEDGNQILREEYEYAVNEDGESYIGKYTVYDYEEGCVDVVETNDHGEVVSWQSLDLEGNEIFCRIFEYAVDENGDCYESKITTTDYESGLIYVSEYNVFGDSTIDQIFDLEGNLQTECVWEYTYDENGEYENVKEYIDGRLVFEILSFETYVGEDYFERYPAITVEYLEDGSTTRIEYNRDGSCTVFEYDAQGNLVSQISYDSEGRETRIIPN